MPITDKNSELAATVARERARLENFIRRRVGDQAESEDILQDVLHDFVEAHFLPAPIEQAGAWLFRVARNRIVDRFRKKRELQLDEGCDGEDHADNELRLDLALPAADDPEAAYVRSLLLAALQQAIDALPEEQRAVFVGHELDGRSFRDMAADSGVPLNTLLARKRYAVRFLRARLQPVYDELDEL
jgi:RNA polymerase sigma factor (sigma-70 family)